MGQGSLVLFKNIGLSDAATGGQTSNVGEPSVANNGNQVLTTGNWYATRSVDDGVSWAQISPFNFFPPVDGGFCCDQTAIYEPSRDLTFWILQYIEKNGTNTLRLAVKKGNTLGNDNWSWYDFTPTSVNPDWEDEWFDYNHAALSDNYLYIGTNAFTPSPSRFTRCVLLRLPLDELAAGSSLNINYFQTSDNFSLRCTLGARNVMHFVSHNSLSQVRVFSWPETSTTVAMQDVDVTPWRAGSYSAQGPDGNNWLGRCDPRITGAWVARGVIGFMWSANRNAPGRPMPYVRVVRLNEQTKAVINEPDIWNADFAFAYPDACPNDRGQVGISLFFGGGTVHPSHSVGVWNDASDNWSLLTTANGTDGPADDKWGDYLACRRHSPDGLTWMATGFTLQGGSSRSAIEPRVVHFGYQEHTGAVRRWENL